MRRITDEQHPVVMIVVQRQGFSVVHADPNRAPFPFFTDHIEKTLDDRQHVFRLQSFFVADAVFQQVINAPDVVRLAVHPHWARAQGGFEPHAPFCRGLAFQFNIYDGEASMMHIPLQMQAHLFPHPAAATVAGNHPVGF
ncbi:hypothetical protein D3C71_1245440 [compost metagenome]